jgi:hypothetical protein
MPSLVEEESRSAYPSERGSWEYVPWSGHFFPEC